MREITVKLFGINELSEKSKNRAIHAFRQKGWNWDESDAELLSETFEEKISEMGYCSDNIAWSLSCCQGDGVCFAGEVDIEKISERLLENKKISSDEFSEIKTLIDEGFLTMELSKGRSYYCILNCNYDGEFLEENTYLEPTLDLLIKLIQDDYSELEGELEKIGYDEIDYKNTDDYIIECMEANDYEFLEDGTFYF